MKRKEAGVCYVTSCPACGDELALGWLPTAVPLPHLRDPARRRLPWRSSRPDGVALDAVTCGCGQVSLALAENAEHARVAVTWTGAMEPTLRVLPQYGSVRDQV